MPVQEITIEAPKKSETLAKKFVEKSQRHHLLDRFRSLPTHNLLRFGEVFFLMAIYFINFWLLLPFFGKEDQTNNAIFSAPLIPILAGLTSPLLGYKYGIRLWLLFFLILFPVAFYFFVREITRRRLTAIIASLVVSLPVSVFLYLRIMIGLLTEDGGQVAALSGTVLVCLTLYRFLRTGDFGMGIFASLGMAAVALTSPLSFVILLIWALMLNFSEMLLGLARLKLFRFLVVCILAAGFAAFWYNPRFLLMTIASEEGKIFLKALANLLPLSFFLLPILGTFGFLLFENRPILQPLFIAFFLTIIFGLLSLGTGVQLSTPSRFLPAFGVSLAFLISVVFARLYDNVRRLIKLKRFPAIYRYRRIIPAAIIALTLISLLIVIEASGRNFQDVEDLVSAETSGQPAKVKRVEILEIRAMAGSLGSILGLSITLATIGAAILLKIKLNPRNSGISGQQQIPVDKKQL